MSAHDEAGLQPSCDRSVGGPQPPAVVAGSGLGSDRRLVPLWQLLCRLWDPGSSSKQATLVSLYAFLSRHRRRLEVCDAALTPVYEGCLVHVGYGIELDPVGRKFETSCGVTWDSIP